MVGLMMDGRDYWQFRTSSKMGTFASCPSCYLGAVDERIQVGHVKEHAITDS
jgi:hypothetical protein